MIALTQRQFERIDRRRSRRGVWDVGASSGFGSDVTLIVGSHATQFGLSVSIDESPQPPTLAEPTARPCDSSLQPGRRLGPFRLIARLGQGAQGDVWKAARDGLEGQVVAVKILNPSLARHQRRLAQFRREAERGAKLAGPSLLQVFEFGEVEGYLYMAMPFVEGVSLHQVIRARRAFVNGEDVECVHPLVKMDDDSYLVGIARTMAQAARALEIVHANRIVHRDVKPANILLDGNRPHAVYLCDLGLGRDLEVATVEQMRDGAGTPMYMSPERLLRAPADEILADVYSMGVTTYEALTLGRPFADPRGVPMSALSAFLARARPRPPRAIDPRIPQPLEAVILKAMARNPSDRYDSAAELAVDLDRWCASVDPSLAVDETRRDFMPHPHLPIGPPEPAGLRKPSSYSI